MTPTRIILHNSDTKDSGTVSWSAIRRYHKDTLGWRDIGYHYGLELVGEEPEILVGRMMNEPGAHCRDDGMNSRSLGICFVGKFDDKSPPEELWDTGIRLVRSLIEVFSLAPDDATGSASIAA